MLLWCQGGHSLPGAEDHTPRSGPAEVAAGQVLPSSRMTDASAPEGSAEPTLPPPTAPASIPVTVSGGFKSEEHATRFANLLAELVRTISCVIDLERLDGITVADDYDRALRELDRGYESSRPLTRSDDDRIVGVAMAPAVLRGDVVKARLIFYAPLLRPIEHAEQHSPEARLAIYVVAHECAHVEGVKHLDLCFPGQMLRRRIPHFDDAIFQQVSEVMWDEYAACRTSALLGGELQTASYVNGLVSVLHGARDRSDSAIRAYRWHGDLDRLVAEAGLHICQPLKLFAYLLGNLDGLRATVAEAALRAQEAIAGGPYAEPFERATEILRHLWDQRGQWTSAAQFDPLRQIARDVLDDAGLVFQRLPDGQVWLDVPRRGGHS